MGDIPYCNTHNGWLSQLSCERCELEEELTKAQQQIADLTAKLEVTNKQWANTLATVNASWEEKIKLRLAQLARYQAALAEDQVDHIDLIIWSDSNLIIGDNTKKIISAFLDDRRRAAEGG
jgi:hypothetical protein